MYESIRGLLKEKNSSTAIVECNGLAYRLQIPLSTSLRLGECGTETMLYLSHVVREDAHTLYAFSEKEERNLFETLVSISGIGPKTAACIIGHMEISALKSAVAAADIRLLSKIPGIGKKTAERLIIEMRDKFKGKEQPEAIGLPGKRSLSQDATCALMNLGYSLPEAQKAVDRVVRERNETDLGRLISAALQEI